MDVSTHALSCPVCNRVAILPEANLLRLPQTIMYRCPFCRTVAVIDTARRYGPRQAGGEQDRRAA